MCHVWGLSPKHVDECLIGRATVEGVDHVGIRELVVLLGEALDVLLEGLIGPQPVITRSHEFLG